MYNEYFGLAEQPFRITPDPRYLWYSEQHKEAKDKILYFINGSGAPVYLIAPVGTGKTSIAKRIYEDLLNDKTKQVAYVISPKLTTTNAFLRFIMDEFKVKTDKNYARSLKLFETFLIDKAKIGITPVLLIDEGQNMSRDMLNLIQYFFNFSTDTQFLIHMAIFAQPELKIKLKRMESLRSRTYPAKLNPLSLDQIDDMINFRWKVAGGDKSPFDQSAINELFHITQGIPRSIVKICDLACLRAAVTQTKKIDDEIIKNVAGEAMAEAEYGNV